MMCVRCRRHIYQDDVTGESALYSPSKAYLLCEPCFHAEDTLIEQAGTNEIPDEIARYEHHLRLGEIR